MQAQILGILMPVRSVLEGGTDDFFGNTPM